MEEKKQNDDIAPETDAAEAEASEQSELELPVWAVIGFDGCIANGLTYDQAVVEIASAFEKKRSGLCIVTEEAAARINSKRDNVL